MGHHELRNLCGWQERLPTVLREQSLLPCGAQEGTMAVVEATHNRVAMAATKAAISTATMVVVEATGTSTTMEVAAVVTSEAEAEEAHVGGAVVAVADTEVFPRIVLSFFVNAA